VGVGGPPRPVHVTSQTGAREWVQGSAESVTHIDNCGAVFGGVRAARRRRRAEGTARRRQTSGSSQGLCSRGDCKEEKGRAPEDQAIPEGVCSLDADGHSAYTGCAAI
jgi:hypothetical protein